MFPTPFETDYLVDYFADGHTASVNYARQTDLIVVTAGDFERVLEIESKLERKYVVEQLTLAQQLNINDSSEKLNLDDETADEGDFLG